MHVYLICIVVHYSHNFPKMRDVFTMPSEDDQSDLWERACVAGVCMTFPPSSHDDWHRMVERVAITEAIQDISSIHEMREMVEELNTNLKFQWERYVNARDVVDRINPSNWHPRYMELARKEEANSCMDMLLFSVMHERAYWKLKMMRSSGKYIELVENFLNKNSLPGPRPTFLCFCSRHPRDGSS